MIDWNRHTLALLFKISIIGGIQMKLMKHTIHCLCLGVIGVWLAIPMNSQANSPFFVVRGLVTDTNGALVDGLEVTVTNTTQNLSETERIGPPDFNTGLYAVAFSVIREEELLATAGKVGDEIKIAVKQSEQVIAEAAHIINNDNIAQFQAIINVQLVEQSVSPILTSIDPDSDLVTGGATVQIIGENFQDGATVTIGGKAATDVFFVSPTELTAKAPEGVAGSTDVVLINPDGKLATLAGGFTYIEEPQFPPYDVNEDGIVNIFDLVIVGGQFGDTGEGLSGDVNGDSVVNIFDLVTVGSHFGEITVRAAPSRHRIVSFPEVSKRTDRRGIAPETEAGRRLRTALTELEHRANADPEIRFVADLLRRWLIDSGEIPAKTQLLPNYPNPFNPETWIPYQLAQTSEVQIFIYNMMGQRVRELKVGFRHAGIYSNRSEAAYWDGRNDAGERVTSGVYFYTLQASSEARSRSIGADNFSATRKMIILK